MPRFVCPCGKIDILKLSSQGGLCRVLCVAAGVAPADLLLLMAASENDAPKVAELLRAGADIGAQVRFTC